MSFYIGLMSGTSVDAIDAVLVQIDAEHTKLIANYTHLWPEQLRDTLLNLSQNPETTISLREFIELDHAVGQEFAQASANLIKHIQIDAAQITAIGCAGQTIYHSPNTESACTYQLGDPNIIAQQTQIPTIADFRRRDVAAGGQGAPLAPAFHQAVFQHPTETRVVLNLGGIANITVLTPDQEIIGFDTGTGNCLLDAWINKHLGLTHDRDGEWASSGDVSQPLLDDLLQDPYFALPAPKTTGRDYFNINWLEQYLEQHPLPPNTIQTTLAQLTIDSIVQAMQPYTPQRMLVCGGGVYNDYLMHGLQKQLECPVESTTRYGVEPDWVEAMCFAWLAHQRLQQQPNNLPSVTGARQAVSMGGIY
ncbi:anhydro-N-acetylmuramic acid kinase [Candidatus Albibeggiatoa sp. nov. NOAA]|uniref:anhydro-N-acetylmuramic acid kinase n=1 Tax=Candidatus Albibeggiatoa sp. nov. NOAA TaxID=3162724 RepID=UPI0032F31D99|nr:anhydro-N-acetylmuramic acid kinase [Thiotrichaceae bacterium]